MGRGYHCHILPESYKRAQIGVALALIEGHPGERVINLSVQKQTDRNCGFWKTSMYLRGGDSFGLCR
jgi:hypothetical protein